MSNHAKIIIPIVLLFIIYVIYLLLPSEELGSFDKIRSGGEINQSINVSIVESKGFERDQNGNIISFYARDKDGAEAKISLKEAAPADIVNAEVVELFGHMHGDNFIALSATIVKPSQ